jgi:hypothetical protein
MTELVVRNQKEYNAAEKRWLGAEDVKIVIDAGERITITANPKVMPVAPIVIKGHSEVVAVSAEGLRFEAREHAHLHFRGRGDVEASGNAHIEAEFTEKTGALRVTAKDGVYLSVRDCDVIADGKSTVNAYGGYVNAKTFGMVTMEGGQMRAEAVVKARVSGGCQVTSNGANIEARGRGTFVSAEGGMVEAFDEVSVRIKGGNAMLRARDNVSAEILGASNISASGEATVYGAALSAAETNVIVKVDGGTPCVIANKENVRVPARAAPILIHENTFERLGENLKTLSESPRFRSQSANLNVKFLTETLPQEQQSAFMEKLRNAGCRDPASSKAFAEGLLAKEKARSVGTQAPFKKGYGGIGR